ANADAAEHEQRLLRAVQPPYVGAGLQRRRAELRHLRIVNVAGADVVVDVATPVHGAVEVVGAQRQLVLDVAGREAATQFGAQLPVAAGVVRAAVVVDVVVAIGREEVARHAAIGTFYGVVAAVGEGDVVVDDRAAVAGRHPRLPGRAEIVGVQRAEVGAVDAHRLLPGLVAEHVLGIHLIGQRHRAEQLVAGGRTLRAGLVVGIQLQLAALAYQPVGGQRVEIATAIAVLDV